jgi:hypothetical protein
MGRGRASRTLLASACAGMLLLPGCRRAAPPSAQAGRPSSPSDVGILVLNDSDRNRTKPPFEDRVHILDAHGRQIRALTNLNICETFGASRAIGVSDDGETFVVCENVTHRLCAYQTRTGAQIWSLPGWFDAAALADGSIYALATKPTFSSMSPLHSNSLVMIDSTGTIVKQAQISGFDLAVDPARKTLWLVGEDIKKCSLDLDRSDGSVWVADYQGSRLRHYARDGKKLETSDRLPAGDKWLAVVPGKP